MTIDPTKIRVGDEVTWTTYGTVTSVDGGQSIRVDKEWIGISRIKSHTPAPRPFVVGGKVRNKRSPESRAEYRGEIDGLLVLRCYEPATSTYLVRDAKEWEPCE